MSTKARVKARKLQHLGPETLMYIAYNLYVIDDTRLVGTARHSMATKSIEEIRAKLESPNLVGRDAEFALAVRAILVSYAGAIWRIRRTFDEAVDMAKLERDQYNRKTMADQAKSIAWRATIRFLAQSGALILLGAALAQVIAIFVPSEAGEVTGKSAPSVALGLTFFLVGQVVSTVVNQASLMRATTRFNRKAGAAWEVFIQGRRRVYDQHLFDLCEEWKRYTGKTYRVISSMSTVFQEDEAMLRQFFSDQAHASRGQVTICKEAVFSFIRRFRRRKEHAATQTA